MIMRCTQEFFTAAGNNSCYADCIVRLASQIMNVEPTLTLYANAYEKGIDSGCIRFNKTDYRKVDNFFVERPADFLSLLTGKKFTCTHEGADYRCKKGEYRIDFWVKSKGNGQKGNGHFCLGDYDPLGKSQTRAIGYIYSTRVFHEVKDK